MRTIVLLILGGGLLWLLLRPTPEAEVVAGADSPLVAGTMLPPAGPDETSPTAESQAPSESPAPTPAEPGPRAASAPVAAHVPQPTRENEIPRAATAPLAGAASASPVEVGLAAALLHAPSALDGIALTAEEGFPVERRRFVQALTALVRGEDARAKELAQGLDTEGSLSGEESRFLRSALRAPAYEPSAVDMESPSPLVRATALALDARAAEADLAAGKPADAVRRLSRVLLAELKAPWPADPITMRRWAQSLARAQAGYRWRRDAHWPALEVKVEKGDSLIAIRKRALAANPDLLLCTGLIARVNQLEGDTVHPGQVLRIPTDRPHMLVDLDAHWALLLAGDEVLEAWEVGVGRQGTETTPGTYHVGEKREEPMWFPPGEAPVPYGDPRNPLGTRWIELQLPDGRPSHLGFHGTNDPDSVGRDASQGCLRMRNPEVEELFEVLPRGSEVLVQP